jgi:DNA-directed RNA polymerase subunit RPC12/RpoP
MKVHDLPPGAADEPLDSVPPPIPSAGTRFPCARCGAKLVYRPGSDDLTCPYCKHENPIPAEDGVIVELSFAEHLGNSPEMPDSADVPVITCTACGAQVTLPPRATSLPCPYCGADLVFTRESRRLILPQAVLPFQISREDARGRFSNWVRRLWFAPTALRRQARLESRMMGVYLPFWTYDCRTRTDYTGERGDDYTETRMVTMTVNGKRVTRPQTVRRTRWSRVRGVVRNAFDDVLVCASDRLPRADAEALEPFDLSRLRAYRDEYLAGFLAESYKLDLATGFEVAKQRMAIEIRQSVCRDIGGDHQRIHSMNVQYSDITFKHILLPLWIMAYRYRGKVYRFLVNAQTGEVRGERPWSVWKIVGAILCGLAVAGAVWWIVQAYR